MLFQQHFSVCFLKARGVYHTAVQTQIKLKGSMLTDPPGIVVEVLTQIFLVEHSTLVSVLISDSCIVASGVPPVPGLHDDD